MQRKLIVGVHDQEPRIFNRIKAALETHLSRLAGVQLIPIKTLAEYAGPLDLLVIIAPPLKDELFVKWLKSVELKCSSFEAIWVPALIIADIEFGELNEILQPASQTNWYFDIVHSEHLDSLPIRVANLLRISEHLKELLRYDNEVKGLVARVDALENQLQDQSGRIEK